MTARWPRSARSSTASSPTSRHDDHRAGPPRLPARSARRSIETGSTIRAPLRCRATTRPPRASTTASGGYEEEGSGYNQNHGWVLWGMAEHYWFTGDNAWLDRVAPNLIKGCDWIINQRARTKTDECVGIRAIETRPAAAGDAGRHRATGGAGCPTTSSATGACNAVGEVLAERGQPGGAAGFSKKPADYKKDILAAFTRGDGPIAGRRAARRHLCPEHPSEVHRRGRSLGWITETLEGSIHLIRCGVVEPEVAARRVDNEDYEDNRYISDQFGYPMPFFERDWFSIGGFSQQPSLLCSPTPYLMRDDIKHYLRAYFNALRRRLLPRAARC